MSYAPPAGKRQKVREGRASDGVDYFQGIEAVETSRGAAPAPAEGPLTYRHYGAAERLLARALDDWLKCSLSLTDFRNGGGYGSDQSRLRPWEDGTTSLESHKRCLKALFELCSKLGVRYWTALDTDLVPDGAGGEPWDEVVEYVQELAARWHVKLLWLAPDLTSHPRYASGALTNSDASVVVQAGAQIKRSLEAAQRLGAECFMLWPGREGFDFFHCDVAREIKLFSKLLKITAEHKERLNYRCQLLITPYNCQYQLGPSWSTWPTWNGQGWRDERVNCYMWDVTSCLYFLKHYNLDRYYKVCTPPGHHMYMANVYNMLGGVTISEQFDCSDSRTLTLMMKCIVDQGAPPAGGINVRVRSAGEPRELVAAHVRRLDALARALRLAARLPNDQALGKHVQQRYASYQSGFGARLAAGDVSLDDCDDHHKKAPAHSEAANSRVEHYELVFQRYLDTCDHI